MYAREATKDAEQTTYDAADEKTIEWLKAQVAKRREKKKASEQLHPELIGRS